MSMGQLIGVSIGGPYAGLIVVAVIVVIVVIFRLYLMRNPGSMCAKCSKCGNVFDASRSFSGFHIGPWKQLKCPACGKISLMNTFVKDPLTWTQEEQMQKQPEPELSSEELEPKRIENSKYESS